MADAFPKNRGGWSGPGRTAARRLGSDSGDDGWLRARRFGAEARNKGGHLSVQELQTEEVEPILWYVVTLFRTIEETTAPWFYALGAPTRLPQKRRTRPLRALDGQFTLGNNGQMYVGGGYVLAENWGYLTEFPDTRGRSSYILFPRRTNSAVTEIVPSLTPDVPVNAAVAFNDALVDGAYSLPLNYSAGTTASGGARAFVTGYDPSLDAYRFGIQGIWCDVSTGASKRKCFLGNTASRQLTQVPFPFSDEAAGNMPLQTSALNMQPQGPGKVHAVYVERGARRLSEGSSGEVITYVPYPGPLKALRSSDHGQTWGKTDLPELTPYLLRRRYAVGPPEVVDYHYRLDDFVTMQVASPIGGGRMALAMVVADQYDHTYLPGEITDTIAGGDFKPMITHWGFFVSDADGLNYVNKPWPMDAEHGVRWTWSDTYAPYVDFSGWHLNNYLGLVVGQSSCSAGNGSFFVPISYLASSGTPTQAAMRNAPMRMLWTVDYGDTWHMSEELPADMRQLASGDNSLIGFPGVSWTVVRGYSASSDGLLYTLVRRLGEGVGLWRTDAKFSYFEKVAVLAGEDQASPVLEVRAGVQTPVFVGSPTIRASVRPGFPGYDKE